MASTAFSAASLIPLAAITDTFEFDNISFEKEHKCINKNPDLNYAHFFCQNKFVLSSSVLILQFPRLNFLGKNCYHEPYKTLRVFEYIKILLFC